MDMPYMVSAKKNYYLLIITILFIIYIAFLIYDNMQNPKNKQIEQKKQYELISSHSIEAFIFGGSNSVNSISARQLSYLTGLRFHNASMPLELENEINYNNFIINIASLTDTKNTRIVIYSSVLPFNNKRMDKYLNKNSNTSFKFIPSYSLIGYSKNYLNNLLENNNKKINSNNKDEMINNAYGDSTNKSENCFYNLKNNKFNPASLEDSTNFLVNKAYFLSNLFLDSKIYIILPSLYFDALNTTNSYAYELKYSFEKKLRLNYAQISSQVNLIIQPQFPIISHICNDPHHATALGRTWRTNDLLKSIADDPSLSIAPKN
jgi:hypothetical protein